VSKQSVRALRLATGVCLVAALGIFASSAAAACPVGVTVCGGEVVQGTTLSTIALTPTGTVGTPVLFDNFYPGGTSTATGALAVIDTNPSWTLEVQDLGTGAGKMIQTGGACTGSESELSTPLTVGVSAPTSGLPVGGNGISVDSAVSLSASAQAVAAAASGGQLLDGNVFTTNYSVSIPSTDVMTTGCVYGLTATYTLQ
jgi:hypothetical protein